MNSWAAEGKYDCHFLCVCVLGDRSALSLSQQFCKELRLTHCTNGFVDREEDLPEYGQLGCRGFILLDADHRVVSTGTSAFMEVRDLAFKHVEALLDAVCARRPLPAVCPGEHLELVKAPPGRPDLRGARGVCVEVREGHVALGFLAGPLRGRAMLVPTDSVRKLDPEDEDNMAGCRTCTDGQCGDSCGKAGACGCSGGACGTGCGEKAGACGAAGGSCGPGRCLDGCGTASPCSTGSCGTGSCGGPCPCSDPKCQPGCAGGPGGCCAASVPPEESDTVEEGALDDAFVSASLNLLSVKVPSMDAEHVTCADALRRLALERSASALQAVLAELSGHFAHEEGLMEKHGFGAHAKAEFSARKTHEEDHRRIIGKVQQQLGSGAARVPSDFVREVLRDFHEHATRYDMQYADQLSAQGAQ